MLRVCSLFILLKLTSSQYTTEEIQFLNQLPIDKLLQLKNSLKHVAYDNTTISTPEYSEFGAQALTMKSPIRRGDYEDSDVKKGDYGKLSNIFSMSVTTLAFLAFGGYLLCLIVHAVKSNQTTMTVPTTQSTLFFNAGIKRPQTQFATYGRKKRDERSTDIIIPPEQLFSSLTHLCEGYVKWSKHNH
ncbi:uncharacterized protein LOC121735025 [Aricia agestis]|uniref:uncharacterized protein LOC121735025 n=1 Tax=Aricia agestis TaxID=91739 RepID=UPI001C207E57|nr:uncharacterized protein LOC121735025 [Aricia agestis]